jgi:signal peptidase II
MGESLPGDVRTVLFTLGAAILVAAAMAWALFSKRLQRTGFVGAALVCAGGIGNLVDRVLQHGHVTDFLNVGLGALRTGIFNVADFVLLVGIALIAHDGMTDRN